MDKISLKNFRRFTELKNIENKGITFLVGPNNSGKSSITKAFWLLGTINWRKIPRFIFFDEPDTNDDNIIQSSFARIVNKFAQDRTISLNFRIGKYECLLEITGDIEDVEGSGKLLKIHDLENEIFFEFNIFQSTLNVIQKQQTVVEKVKNDNLEFLEKQIDEIIQTLEVYNLKKKDFEYFNLVDKLQNLRDKRELIQKSALKSKNIAYNYTLEFGKITEIQNILLDYLQSIKSQHTYEILKAQKGKKNSNEFAVLEAINQNSKEIALSLKGFLDAVSKIEVHYIPKAGSAKHQLFHKFSIDDNIAKAVYNINDWGIYPGTPSFEFIRKWLQKFEICDTFEILEHAGEAYEFNLIKNKISFPLSDEGKGSIQIIFMLLMIVNAIENFRLHSKNDHTILIEEPESNLHPAFQSNLADLFLEVYEKYKIKFIVETHSEYVLRRSQVIVAEKKYGGEAGDNPFRVYYFPKGNEEQPYLMEYEKNGRFNRNFGEGFFDEATNSTVTLLKLLK